MTESTELMTVDNICSRVYVIRGQQVMLDYDLAEIYGYEVKRMNEQVKRNITRFPEDFMFQLTKDEIDFVKSQFATSRNQNMYTGQDGGRRKAPYAFIEQGIYMLATVLRGELAENARQPKCTTEKEEVWGKRGKWEFFSTKRSGMWIKRVRALCQFRHTGS